MVRTEDVSLTLQIQRSATTLLGLTGQVNNIDYIVTMQCFTWLGTELCNFKGTTRITSRTTEYQVQTQNSQSV